MYGLTALSWYQKDTKISVILAPTAKAFYSGQMWTIYKTDSPSMYIVHCKYSNIFFFIIIRYTSTVGKGSSFITSMFIYVREKYQSF